MKKIAEVVKETMKYFFMVTVLILIASTIYVSVFYGSDAYVQVNFLWQIMLAAFLSSLSRLLFYTRQNRNLGKKEYWIRWFLCYGYVNAVNLGLGLWFGWFDLSSFPMVAGMFICILLVFLTVAVVVYLVDSGTTKEINQKLQERNAGLSEEE